MITFVAKLWASSFSLPSRPTPETRRIVNGTVDQLYTQFNHVMVVGDDAAWHVWADHSELNAWCIDNDCYFMYDRAWYDKWRHRWESNGIGGGDYYFIATNNTESFVHAQMVWG